MHPWIDRLISIMFVLAAALPYSTHADPGGDDGESAVLEIAGNFFDDKQYYLAKQAAVEAGDLSGLTYNKRTGNLFALDETIQLLELDFDGNELRRLPFENKSGFDLEAVAYVKNENGTSDLIAFFDEAGGRLLLISIGLDDTAVDLLSAQTYFLGNDLIKSESLAYNAAVDEYYVYGVDKDFWRVKINNGVPDVERRFGPPPGDGMFFDSSFHPFAFIRTSGTGSSGYGINEFDQVTGNIISSFGIPLPVFGKLEGLAFNIQDKSFVIVKESSIGQINFYRFDLSGNGDAMPPAAPRDLELVLNRQDPPAHP